MSSLKNMWPKSSRKIARQATLQLTENISNASLIEEYPKQSYTNADPDEKLSLWAALRRYPRITLYSSMLTSTILLWGYDQAVVGGVSSMPEFQKVFGVSEGSRWIIPTLWLSLWSVGGSIGGMFGSLIAGWVGDIIGRRWMLGSSTILSVGAVALCLLSDTAADIGGRRGLFLVAKSVQGLAIGACATITQTWMSETVPQQLRGSILPLFPIFTMVGQIIGSIVIQTQLYTNGRNSYRITFATQFAFSVMPLIVSFLIPESPAWLLRKNKVDRARRNNKRLEYSKRSPNAHILSFENLQKTIARERNKSGENASYLDCFKNINFRRTGLVMLMNVLPDFFGLSLLGNANYFLQQVGQPAKTANLFFIVGIALGLAGNLCSFYVLSRIGRRVIVLSTLLIVTVLWLAIGVAGSIEKTGNITIWFTSITMMLIIFTAGLGVWPASYVIAAETSSLRLRARTQGLGWFTNGISGVTFGLAMPYTYNPDAANLGGQTGYIFFALSAVAIGLSWFCLPEMKGRSIGEIDAMFEAGVAARKFAGWRGAVEGVDGDFRKSEQGGLEVPKVGRVRSESVSSVGSEDTGYRGYEYGRIGNGEIDRV